jgi:hypothetical protein
VEGRKKKKFKKNGNSLTGLGVDPRPVGDRWSPAMGRRPRTGRRPAVARQSRVDTCACQSVHIFLKYFYLKKKNSWKFGKWARAFGRMGVQHLHFLKVGSANSSKIHGEWRFHFFPTFFSS